MYFVWLRLTLPSAPLFRRSHPSRVTSWKQLLCVSKSCARRTVTTKGPSDSSHIEREWGTDQADQVQTELWHRMSQLFFFGFLWMRDDIYPFLPFSYSTISPNSKAKLIQLTAFISISRCLTLKPWQRTKRLGYKVVFRLWYLLVTMTWYAVYAQKFTPPRFCCGKSGHKTNHFAKACIPSVSVGIKYKEHPILSCCHGQNTCYSPIKRGWSDGHPPHRDYTNIPVVRDPQWWDDHTMKLLTL